MTYVDQQNFRMRLEEQLYIVFDSMGLMCEFLRDGSIEQIRLHTENIPHDRDLVNQLLSAPADSMKDILTVYVYRCLHGCYPGCEEKPVDGSFSLIFPKIYTQSSDPDTDEPYHDPLFTSGMDEPPVSNDEYEPDDDEYESGDDEPLDWSDSDTDEPYHDPLFTSGMDEPPDSNDEYEPDDDEYEHDDDEPSNWPNPADLTTAAALITIPNTASAV